MGRSPVAYEPARARPARYTRACICYNTSMMLTRRMFLGLLGGSLASQCLAVPGTKMVAAAAKGVIHLYPPTKGQRILDGSVRKGVFMDTGTGRPESGMFGNVRKYADGSPRYHEASTLRRLSRGSVTRTPRMRSVLLLMGALSTSTPTPRTSRFTAITW